MNVLNFSVEYLQGVGQAVVRFGTGPNGDDVRATCRLLLINQCDGDVRKCLIL